MKGLLLLNLEFIDQWFEMKSNSLECYNCVYDLLNFCDIPDDIAEHNREWTYVMLSTSTVCSVDKDSSVDRVKCAAKCAPKAKLKH
jgi:hypothetical protein